jgi:lipopolysaccharide export system permease protein
MKILHRYIAKDYLVTFALTIVVFTFVMSVGALVRIIDLIARGAAVGAVLEIFLFNTPYLLQFTIPMSALTATLLVVSRLSMEGEITAMRASGLSLPQIAAPIFVSAVILASASLGVAHWVSPISRHLQRAAMARLSDTNPIALLEEGRFVRDFPGLLVYVGRKSREGKLQDVVIYDFTQPRARLHVRAREGQVEYDADARRLAIRLRDVHMEKTELSARGQPVKTETAYAAEYPQDIDVSALLRTGSVRKKLSDYTAPELVAAARTPWPHLPRREAERERMRFLVELNNRTAMAFGCFAFTLVGVSLGIRSKRRESSIGVALSLAILFVYYLFMILAKEMIGHPEWRPDLFPWIPVIGAELAGLWHLHRNG